MNPARRDPLRLLQEQAASVNSCAVWRSGASTSDKPLFVATHQPAHILIIDDIPLNLELLGSSLEGDHDLQYATSAAQGLELVRQQAPDLILLDVMMPDMDGYQMLQLLQADPATRDIPVIFVTAQNDSDSETHALAAGAVDFIHKPINPPVVRARVRLQLELRQRVVELQRALQRVEFLSRHDPLTGLPNRAWFHERLDQALALARRQGSQLALMFLDLDRFKPVNDAHGHAAGDALLQQAAQRMSACLRETDTVGRIGGDEFVLLLQGVDGASAARQAAEKVRLALNETFVLEDLAVTIAATIGVAVYPDHGASAAELTHHADLAMYQAKQGGRNQVRLYQPD